MAKSMEKDECCHKHHMWMGAKMLVLGLLVIANSYYAIVDWAMFVGAILAVGGFLKLVVPHHHH